MAKIPSDSITMMRSAPEVQSVATEVNDTDTLSVAAAVINSAANAGQMSCILEQSLSPELIQSLVDSGYIVEGIGRADSSRPILIDWSSKVTSSQACDYSDVTHNSPVYNAKTLQEAMWVQLPNIAKNFELTQLSQIQPSEAEIEDLSDVSKENVWIKVPIDLLDTEVGSKVYKMSLKHKCIDDTMTLYFGYIIQDDDPATSYIYMNK